MTKSKPKKQPLFLFEKPKSDAGEGEAYSFCDPQNFAEYRQLVKNGCATEQQHHEFYLRMIWHFIESVGEDRSPDKWVMNALADAFLKVVYGGRWEDEFPLPWTKVSLPYSRAEWSALEIYCTITNALNADNKLTVKAAIEIAVKKYSVSPQKASSAYYLHKKQLSKISLKT
jgi:hypothetical protein